MSVDSTVDDDRSEHVTADMQDRAPSESEKGPVLLLRNIVGLMVESVRRVTEPEVQRAVGWAVGAVVLAVLTGATLMSMAGYNAGLAYIALVYGAATQVDRVLFYATPLVLTGLSVALAFKCGLFNIGAEGQLYVGSIAATVLGYMFALPIIVHPLACLLFAMLVGGLWALVPGVLKAYRGAHEVVTTMMLSYVAILLTQWMVSRNGPFFEPGQVQPSPQTPLILPSAYLPKLGSPFLHAGLLIAVGAVIVVDYVINGTVLGYEMRAVGLNREAAEYAGINAKKNMAIALTLSGVLAGLAGGTEILGYHHRFRDGWSGGLGWDGITVAVLGNNNPWGVLFGALFFGALKAGGTSMQRVAGVPIEMVSVIEGLIVLFVAAPKLVDWLARSGVQYAVWFREQRPQALPHLMTTTVSLVLGAVGLVIAFTSSTGTIMAFLFMTGAFLALVAFFRLVTLQSDGITLALFASIEWLLGAGTAAATGLVSMAATTSATGLFLLVVALLSLRLERTGVLSSGNGGVP